MRKYEPGMFKKLASQLRFSLSDTEAEDIANEFGILIDQIALLEKIDTSDVVEMVYPFEEETSFMREDVVESVLSAEEALMNAPQSKNGFFVTRKVVL